MHQPPDDFKYTNGIKAIIEIDATNNDVEKENCPKNRPITFI